MTLFLASVTGADEAAIALAHGADVNQHNENGATALSWAVRGGYDGIARALRAHGASG